jgi:hypothetical protein
MRQTHRTMILTATAVIALAVAAPEAQRGRGGGRGGRGAIQSMTLTGPWADGAVVPATHVQLGEERSPALQWSGAPEGVAAFVLIAHDPDAPIGDGTDDMLHWLVWNIPGTATGLPEGVPHGAELPDGARQISATGPYYRGPAAPAAGPAHHFVVELFALDATINVPAVGQSAPATRAAVVAAMAGHIRAKATLIGRNK